MMFVFIFSSRSNGVAAGNSMADDDRWSAVGGHAERFPRGAAGEGSEPVRRTVSSEGGMGCLAAGRVLAADQVTLCTR